MGEEEKKPEGKQEGEVKKAEEARKTEEAPKKEGPKAEEKKAEDPPPPQEIVLRVFMHCEGCARKVRRCLKGFEGVEDVQTDCKTHEVVVKGEKADPLKVLGRVQRKSHRQVELLSPIPKPKEEEPKKADEEKEPPKPEEKKEEPQLITMVLQIYMHCEACAQEIKKRIQRMKGVENAEPDLKGSQVIVKGVFEPEKLVEYVYKRTGKQAVIVKVDPEKKEEAKGEEGKEEKKAEDGGEKEKKAEEDSKDKKEDGGAAPNSGEEAAKAPEGSDQEGPKLELKKNEFYYDYPQNFQVYPPQRFAQEFYAYPETTPAPQIFSDENPNACSVM